MKLRGDRITHVWLFNRDKYANVTDEKGNVYKISTETITKVLRNHDFKVAKKSVHKHLETIG